GVPQRVQEVRPADLPELAGAVVMNSWTPAVPVHRIGETSLPEASSFVEHLRRAFAAEPLVTP
ncbi:MAG: branched-chain amino acid aminotransferase, partial [Stackebrandtia sp.]